MKRAPTSATEDFRRQNLVCARIIADDPVRYPDSSLMQQWAQAVLAREKTHEPHVEAEKSKVSPRDQH